MKFQYRVVDHGKLTKFQVDKALVFACRNVLSNQGPYCAAAAEVKAACILPHDIYNYCKRFIAFVVFTPTIVH